MWGFAPPPFHIPLYKVFTSEENKKALWSDIYDEMEGGWLDRETFSWRDNVFVIVIFRLIKFDNSLNVSSATSVIGSISIANLVRTIEKVSFSWTTSIILKYLNTEECTRMMTEGSLSILNKEASCVGMISDTIFTLDLLSFSSQMSQNIY